MHYIDSQKVYMELISVKSKTEQLVDFLREEINKCNSGNGGKILSSRALAKNCNASQTIARKAFERLENEGLLESRHGSGTYIRQQMKSGQSVAILNEIDISHHDTSYFYIRIVQQLRIFFVERKIPVKLYLGYQIPGMPANANIASDSLIKDIKKGVISGIISVAGFNTDEWKKPLIDSHLPLVGFDFPNGIDLHRNQLIQRGVDILLQKGCKSPWIITNNENYFDHFISCIEKKRLVSKNIFPAIKPFSEFNINAFGYYSIIKIFGNSPKNIPDGLLFTDDIIFKNAMMGILELGLKIPEKLKIVTHSNKGSGIFIPFPVTMLEYDPDFVAEKYGFMLINMLKGKDLPPGKITVVYKEVDYQASSDGNQYFAEKRTNKAS